MTTYIKTPVSEKPHEPGKYDTDLGEMLFDSEGSWTWSNYEKQPKWWLKPILPEDISLEEAKDQIAKKYNCDDWDGFLIFYSSSGGPYSPTEEEWNTLLKGIDEVYEFHIAQNTMDIIKESEKFRDLYERQRKETIFIYNKLIKTEQQVKTFTKAIKTALELTADNDVNNFLKGFTVLKEALSTLNN